MTKVYFWGKKPSDKSVDIKLKPSAGKKLLEAELTSRELVALIDHAKRAVSSGERQFRRAANYLAQARDRGMPPRKIASAVGKSASWVNRLRKWSDANSCDAPLKAERRTHEIVNGDKSQRLEGDFTPSSDKGPGSELKIGDVQSDLGHSATSATDVAVGELGIPCAFHLPPSLNRQDPDRAFQQLVQRWVSTMRDQFLNAPPAAQARLIDEIALSVTLDGSLERRN